MIGEKSVWEVHTNKEAIELAEKQRANGPKIPKKKKNDPNAPPEEVKERDWKNETSWILEKVFSSGISKAKGSGLGNGNMSCIMIQF